VTIVNPTPINATEINATEIRATEIRATKIRATRVPVAMITLEGSAAPVLEPLPAGACDYFRKPFSPHRVRTQVLPPMEPKTREPKL
jgi:DNA-binding NtrC family response regulator